MPGYTGIVSIIEKYIPLCLHSITLKYGEEWLANKVVIRKVIKSMVAMI